MRRADNLWEKIVDPANLDAAADRALRGRRGRRDATEFEADRDRLLAELADMLDDGFASSEYRFRERVVRGKARTIATLPLYPDRVAQWAVMLQCAPVFERTFSPHSYSSIPGRGHHLAHSVLRGYLTDPRAEYALQTDFRRFFESVDKDLVTDRLRRTIKDGKVLGWFDAVVHDYPRDGLPLGNVTSQWLANLYLTDLDRYLKEGYHCRWYLRYMDDIVVLGWSKPWLHRVRRVIAEEGEGLGLDLRTWQVYPVRAHGVDFAGYRAYPGYSLMRTANKTRLKRCMADLGDRLADPAYAPTARDVGQWASYKGMLDHCDGHRLAQATVDPIGRVLEMRT